MMIFVTSIHKICLIGNQTYKQQQAHVMVAIFAIKFLNLMYLAVSGIVGKLHIQHYQIQLFELLQTHIRIRIRIRIRNLYCPYFAEKYRGTRKYINEDIWIPTHYKQTKTLSENTKQWCKIIKYTVEQKLQWNDFVHIMTYATGHSCNNTPGRHRTRRGRHCSETI